jgi:glucose-1-phosphate adenylyltransferase
MRNTIAFVLGGGQGTRLFPLTQLRSKPAVPLGGKYRLIDIPLSNCINSGLNRIYVLTQFMSVSLHRHIRQTYRFDQFSGGFVELLAAQQTMDDGTDWYQGTADAVRKNLRYIQQAKDADYVIILSGDQLYRMDYADMLRSHVEAKANVTIGAMPVKKEDAHRLGVMRIDATGRVVGFLEKPQSEAELEIVRNDPAIIDSLGVNAEGRECLASMGIYIFNRETLCEVLEKTDYQDFGREIFPASIRTRHVQAHAFDSYWEDIGTIRAFYDTNLKLANEKPDFVLADPDAPIYSRARFLPPTRIQGSNVTGSVIADGCRIGRNTTIENSIIGLRCIIGDNVTIKDSIIMGADFYESKESCDSDVDATRLGIGDNSVIDGTIVDKNCRIGAGVRVANDEGETNSDHGQLMIRDGIPVVVKEAVLPSGWKIEASLSHA